MGQYADAERNYRDAIDSLQALERRLPADDRPARAPGSRPARTGRVAPQAEPLPRGRVMAPRCGPAPRAACGRVLHRSQPWPGPWQTAATSSVPCWPGWPARCRGPSSVQPGDQGPGGRLCGSTPGEPENRVKLAQLPEQSGDPRGPERSRRRPNGNTARSWSCWPGSDPPRASLPGVRWQAARASNNLAMVLMPRSRPVKRPSRSLLTKAQRRAGSAQGRISPDSTVSARAGVDLQQSGSCWARDRKRSDVATEARSARAADRLKELAAA